MEKLDWKKDLKQLYFPPAEPVTVQVEVTGFQGKLFRPGHP